MPSSVSSHVDVGLAEDGEQVAGAGLLQLLAHQQVGVHPHHQHRDAAELAVARDAGEALVGRLDA